MYDATLYRVISKRLRYAKGNLKANSKWPYAFFSTHTFFLSHVLYNIKYFPSSFLKGTLKCTQCRIHDQQNVQYIAYSECCTVYTVQTLYNIQHNIISRSGFWVYISTRVYMQFSYSHTRCTCKYYCTMYKICTKPLLHPL